MERMIMSRDIKHMACVERIKYLEEENKKLNEEIENHKQNIMQDELEIIPKLEEENEKLKETIKDHQLYEEKLEHRIIELEELLHGE